MITRRRKGWGQERAARHYKVKPHTYRLWERDRHSETPPPRVKTGKLEPWECYFLRRRRSKTTIAELSKAMDTSRFWIIEMEAGRAPLTRLENHWRACG